MIGLLGLLTLVAASGGGAPALVRPAPTPSIAWNAGWPAPAPAPSLGKGYWLSHGNHRYEIVAGAAGPNVAHLRWRRTDATDPVEKPSLLLDDANASVSCAWLPGASADAVRVAFNASRAGAVLHLYYMPFTTCEYENGACRSGARSTYLNRSSTPAACRLAAERGGAAAGPPAEATAVYQARDAFQSFDPMGFAMSASELAALRAAQPDPGILLVAEDRSRPVSGRRFLPSLWAGRGAGASVLNGTAAPGEHYTWQLAVAALESGVTIHRVSFSDFSSGAGSVISSTAMRCMNMGGQDYWGRAFTQVANVSKGEVRALWMAAVIPADATAGLYHGRVSLHIEGRGVRTTAAQIAVSGKALQRGGDDDIDRGTRLHWMDSKAGLDDSLTAPFTPLVIEQEKGAGVRLSMLGKVIVIGANGLLQRVSAGSTVVLQRSMRLDLRVDGAAQALTGWRLRAVSVGNSSAQWASEGTTPDGDISVSIRVEVDATGFVDYAATLASRSRRSASLELVVPSEPGNSRFRVGLGQPGGFLTKDVVWKWDGVNGNSGAWTGSTKGGLRTFLKGSDELWQAGDPYDSHYSPPVPNDTWANRGQGGATLCRNGTFVASTQEMVLEGSRLFNWSVLVTPVRPLNLTQQFKERWAQLSGPANYTQLAENGVTVVNIHQGNTLNPWINYPYLTSAALRAAADECRQLGVRYSIYNTMRELSNRCRELHAMFHLNDTQRMIVSGAGGGADWLQEHLRHDYLAAWSNPIHHTNPALEDAGVRVMAMSRWNNYYAQGIEQARREYHSSGVYLDEIAYDRVTMLRTKRLLGPAGVVDHHCHTGAHCGSCAMNYMEHFPFIDRLWYGEGFSYGTVTADYWLAEISGLPFGLGSDMLRYSGTCSATSTYGCAFPYRGMLVGSAHRGPVDDESAFNSPVGTWALWDGFGIHEAEMYGWWEDEHPVASEDASVKVTSYVRSGRGAIVVLAWFASPLEPTPVANGSASSFCASCPPCGNGKGSFYIKTGGSNSPDGWHNSAGDRCCRSAPGECRWFHSRLACEAALSAGPACLPCTKPDRVGCPTGIANHTHPAPSSPPAHVRLTFNWTALGLDAHGANLTAPTIAPFQCYAPAGSSLAAPQAAQCKEARALALGSSAVSVPLLSPDYSRSMGDHGLILWLSKA